MYLLRRTLVEYARGQRWHHPRVWRIALGRPHLEHVDPWIEPWCQGWNAIVGGAGAIARLMFMAIAMEIVGATRGDGTIIVGWMEGVGLGFVVESRAVEMVDGLALLAFVVDEEGMHLEETWKRSFGGNDSFDGGKVLVETGENGHHEFVVGDLVFKITKGIDNGLQLLTICHDWHIALGRCW